MVYRLWVKVGEYLGFGGRYFRELNTQLELTKVEVLPKFEKVLKEGNYGS